MGHHGGTKGPDAGDSDFMGLIFGTPREGGAGGPMFTPRGTLAALSQATGKQGAALSLGMPLQGAPKEGATPRTAEAEQDAVNMGFAQDWVERMFLTPRASGDDGEIDQSMAEAIAWLQENFGGATTPRGSGEDGFSQGTALTPRGAQPATLLNITEKTDDAVMHAAMQATLATPRTQGSGSEKPMGGAVSKMFNGRLQRV
jgi:hypothetical protein